MATVRGGDKFEAAMRDLARRLDRPEVLRVGFLEGAKYPDGTPVALVAAVQNYGSGKLGIPPRPFFTNMVADKSASWPAAIEANLVATHYDVDLTLELVGQGIAGQLRRSIIDTNAPPLAPSTIARKGFDKPLIHTSHMLNSVDYEVRSTP